MISSPTGMAGSEDAPARWLQATTLLNLCDDRLRIRAHSLVQLTQSDQERVLVIWAFVQSMAYCAPGSQGMKTARQVLDAKMGDGFGKSTLFVALLRSVNIPARMRFVKLQGEVLRGLTSNLKTINHVTVEIWLDNRWIKTDTHIYDLHYLVCAREKLTKAGWRMGYGIHCGAHSVWNARGDAFAAFSPKQPDGAPLADLGVFDDPKRFRRAQRVRGKTAAWLGTQVSAMRWALAVRFMALGVRNIRADIAASAPKPTAEPARISPDS